MDLKEETRGGFKVTVQRKKLWSAQLKLVKKLLEVCERHNLKIWADGGTLLGCVREHGYIPWDDDIDMCMMRPDYDKLVEISQQEFTGCYFFQSAYSDIKYPRGHSQLRLQNTTAILIVDIDKPFHQGVFIDIFALDGIPTDKADLTTLRQKVMDQRRKLQIYCRSMNPLQILLKPWKYIKHKKVEHEVKRLGYKQAYADYENLFRAFPVGSTSYIGELAFMFDLSVLQKQEYKNYADTIYMPFEDIQMPVPVGYDTVLRIQFGDNYMTPIQEPTIHGGFLVIDTERDYREYLDRLRKYPRKYKRQEL